MKGVHMRAFDYSRLYDRTWDTDILNLVAKIHECKGRQDLFIRQKPVELDRLVEIAKIQSTEASNRIEGIVTTSTRMKQLFEQKTRGRKWSMIKQNYGGKQGNLEFLRKCRGVGAGVSFSRAVRIGKYGGKQGNLEFLRKIQGLTIQTVHLRDR